MRYVAPSSPQSIRGVLEDWLRLFGRSFRQCWGVAAVGASMVAILCVLVKPELPPQAMSVCRQRLWLWSMTNAPQGRLAHLLVALIDILVGGGVLVVQIGAFRGRSVTFVEAATTTLRRFPRLLAGYVLWGIAVMTAGTAVGLVAALIAWGTVRFAIRSSSSASGRVFADGFAVVFILIPVMYMIVRLAFWQTAIFAEDDRATDAIGRSWRLVKAHGWRTAAILAIAAAVASVPGAIVPLLLGTAEGKFTPKSLNAWCAFSCPGLEVF